MGIGTYFLILSYLFCFLVVISMNPLDQSWLPKLFQERGQLRKMAPVVLALPVLCALVLFVVLVVWKACYWTRVLVYKHKQKRAQKIGEARNNTDLEAARRISQGSILSESDIPPMFDGGEFSASPSTSFSTLSATNSMAK